MDCILKEADICQESEVGEKRIFRGNSIIQAHTYTRNTEIQKKESRGNYEINQEPKRRTLWIICIAAAFK